MAYLYRKPRSPFWYVVYLDADQKERHKSTGLCADDPNQTAQAKALRAELEAKEHHRRPVVNSQGWDIHSPRAITYGKAIEYIDWRTSFKKKTGKTAGRNTAIMELKLLAMIMGEAVRLGHADANPLVSLKLRRDKAAKKPELTDKEIREIRKALKAEPMWMQTAFDIALHTGCRLREARLPMNCVDFNENKITFPSPKGGEDRAFSIPMPTALRPLFERLGKARKYVTLEFPFQPSRRWQQFFIKINKPHLCFHCLRVTYVNRLRRAGVPREAAMRLVNHSSELIHQIYQREKVEDVAQWRDAVEFPE